jgi:bla regulator protein blaR1
MSGIDVMAQVVAQALLHFLWQGAAVGLVAGWGLSLLVRQKASMRYAVAVGALLLMAALPIATALWLASGTPTAPVAATAVDAVPSGPAERIAVSPDVPNLGRVTRTFGASLMPLILGLWLAGVAALSLYHLGGWRWMRRLSRQGWPASEAVGTLARNLCERLGIRRAVALLESSAVSVPMVVGWLRPVVLIPASALTGLSPQQLAAILAHELAHVRRHDYLVNLFQTAVETLLFYHPAVWWVSAQIRRERENCCDDLAVAVCGDRLGYARALVDLEGLRSVPQLALAATGGSLSDRVRRLVGVPRRPARRSWAAGLLALTLLPASAAIQLACHHKPAADVTVPTNVEQGTWTATLGSDDYLTVEITPRPKPPNGIKMVVERSTQFQDLKVGPDVRFELREADGTYHFQGSFDGKRGGQGTYTFFRYPPSQQGTWSAELKGNRIRLEVTLRKEGWGSWTSVDEYPRSWFYGVPGLDHHFELRRDAGTLRFQGSFAGQRGRGTFTFAANPMFAAAMGYDTSSLRLLELALADVSLDFVREMKQLGFAERPSPGAWAHHGVFQFVHHLLGIEPPDSFADRLEQFRRIGINPEYARGMKEVGLLHVQPWQLVELRNHGIEPAYVKGLRDSGYRRLFPERIIELHEHGITPEWLRGIVEAGLADVAPDQLISMRDHDIDGDFIHKARAAGYQSTRPEELISLRERGKV